MAGIGKRVFGADLHPRVRQKLEMRQALAEQSRPGESVELDKSLFDKDGAPISDDYGSNFGGVLDLSSRTPFARVWTAVQIHRHTETRRFPKDRKNLPRENDKRYMYVQDGDELVEKKVDKYERIVYEINNHNVGLTGKPPNERIEDGSSGLGQATLAQVLPNPF